MPVCFRYPSSDPFFHGFPNLRDPLVLLRPKKIQLMPIIPQPHRQFQRQTPSPLHRRTPHRFRPIAIKNNGHIHKTHISGAPHRAKLRPSLQQWSLLCHTVLDRPTRRIFRVQYAYYWGFGAC